MMRRIPSLDSLKTLTGYELKTQLDEILRLVTAE